MPLNVAPLHAAMRAEVDREILPGVSIALLQGEKIVDTFCYGYADREANVALREDHIFRAFSSTKLVTSCAVLLLWERGQLQLDDAIEDYIPQLGNRMVLRPHAKDIGDVEPARSSITIRHLMTHTSGLSYGIFTPGAVLSQAYKKSRLREPNTPLRGFINALAPLPLAFHPGTQWEYSMATDVLGYLVEVISGQSFGEFIAANIFEPLGMVDTAFYVPPEKASRLTALYSGVDPANASTPGLVRVENIPFAGAFLERTAFESGGGGLVTTLGDSVRMVQSMLPGGKTLLQRKTIQAMASNQLPGGMEISLPGIPYLVGRAFGLGSSISLRPGPLEPGAVTDEVSWGGLAGTDWWFNPRLNIAGVLMTHRFPSPWGEHVMTFRREAYKALGC